MGLFYLPRVQAVDTNGNPYTGGKLYFYEVGTVILKTIYSDKALATAHANPVVADSSGIWDNIYTDGAYKVVLKDTSDVTVWTEDDVTFGASGDFFGDISAISATTAIDATYAKKHIRASGTISLTLLAAASAAEGFEFSVENDGTGIVTLDPNGAEQINDSTTLLLAPGDGGICISDGTEWSFVGGEALKPWNKGADIASAAALALGIDGNYFDVTGAVAITSIGTTSFIGTVIKLHFDGALTLTHHATDLILPGAADITTAAGDEAEFIEYASGDWRCTAYLRAAGIAVSDLADGTDGQLITWDAAGAPATVAVGTAGQVLTSNGAGAAPTFQTRGKGVQKVIGTTATMTTTTTLVPFDDTIPQNTEGAEVVTVAITPLNTANRLIITASIHMATSAGQATGAIALFQDSTASALATGSQNLADNGPMSTVILHHEMAAGTVSATTFKIRGGSNIAGTVTFNGSAGGRIYGGVAISQIEIVEVAT